MHKLGLVIVLLLCLLLVGTATAAPVVPDRHPAARHAARQVGNLETPDKCDNCHGGYNTRRRAGPQLARQHDGQRRARSDLLGHAGRRRAGLRRRRATCASAATAPPAGYAGRSTPTDGSGLTAGDADGVDCDTCHKMTNPNNSEHLGVMNAPFIANDEQTPATGYYGSGMDVALGRQRELGPYSRRRRQAPVHAVASSTASVDFCGTCHDVSNPAVGDLAHNNGAQAPLRSGSVQRRARARRWTARPRSTTSPTSTASSSGPSASTRSGALSKTLVSDYSSCPPT